MGQTVLRSGGSGGPEALVKELRCEIRAILPYNRLKRWVNAESPKALPVLERLKHLTMQGRREINGTFSAIAEPHPNNIIAAVLCFIHVKKHLSHSNGATGSMPLPVSARRQLSSSSSLCNCRHSWIRPEPAETSLLLLYHFGCRLRLPGPGTLHESEAVRGLSNTYITTMPKKLLIIGTSIPPSSSSGLAQQPVNNQLGRFVFGKAAGEQGLELL